MPGMQIISIRITLPSTYLNVIDIVLNDQVPTARQRREFYLKENRKSSSKQQMLAGYLTGISSLHAINTDYLYANQRDDNVWQKPLDQRLGPQNCYYLCRYKWMYRWNHKALVILNRFVYWGLSLIRDHYFLYTWVSSPSFFGCRHFPHRALP